MNKVVTWTFYENRYRSNATYYVDKNIKQWILKLKWLLPWEIN